MESRQAKHWKKLDKYRKRYEKRKEFCRLLKEYAPDIIASDNFRSTRNIFSMAPCRSTDIVWM